MYQNKKILDEDNEILRQTIYVKARKLPHLCIIPQNTE